MSTDELTPEDLAKVEAGEWPLHPDGRRKRLTGAQRTKIARRRRGEVTAAEEAAGYDEAESSGGEEFDDLGKDFADAVRDPTVGTLPYVRKALLIAFNQICTSRTLPNRERWRLMKEYAAVLGMTSNRTELEERTKRLEALLKDARQHGAVRYEENVERPETARGRTRRGPRPAPEGTPPEDPPEEE